MVETEQTEIYKQVVAFGENLRRARKRARLTQVELSTAAPLDRAAISRLECGERAPDLPTLLRICAALGTEPRDMLRGIGPKVSPGSVPKAAHAQASTNGHGGRFGANLKWARIRAGISQERLALDAKVDRAAISVYENGGREPNLRTVLKLALKLEVRPALLLDGITP
ncbi:MAG TPA: helix-turn-helix transcriptional regulator [Solirubrobacteraceae bacterium]|jgi:transcriptional regulator with XRE-family HTH domain|nr:helix-turn-helix transcriptional regulator [Solirubrobacteraceae bacterium]